MMLLKTPVGQALKGMNTLILMSFKIYIQAVKVAVATCIFFCEGF